MPPNNRKKIKVRIPPSKQKFYKQCELDIETWEAIKIYYLSKEHI